MAFAEFSKEVFSENERLAFLAVSAWILRKDHFIHGFNPSILAKFDSSMFFYDGICRAFKGDVLQKLNDWPFWPFMLGHVGRINSSMGLSPASLPNLTVLRFSMMAFAEIFEEVFSETERLALLAVYAWALTKINSSMGLSPASLQNLTVLCFSMTAFAKKFSRRRSPKLNDNKFWKLSLPAWIACVAWLVFRHTYELKRLFHREYHTELGQALLPNLTFSCFSMMASADLT